MKYSAFGKNIIFEKVENPEKSKQSIIISSKFIEDKSIFKVVECGPEADVSFSGVPYVILLEFQYRILDAEKNLVIGEKDAILAIVEFEDERN